MSTNPSPLFNNSYNPAQVMMQAGASGGPYLGGPVQQPGTTSPTGFPKAVGPVQAPPQNPSPDQGPTSAPQAPFSGLPGESIRATGPNAGYDSAYRQNLASYAGGQFMRPGGALSFNPTGPLTFGNPTGGGNDPVLGMPTTLLAAALGGNPFTIGGAAPATTNPNPVNPTATPGGGGGGGLDPSQQWWWAQMVQPNGPGKSWNEFNYPGGGLPGDPVMT